MQHFLYIYTWPPENPTIWEFFKDAKAPLTKVVLKALVSGCVSLSPDRVRVWRSQEKGNMILDRAELIGEHNIDPRSNTLARAAGSGSNWFVVVRFKKLDSFMVMLKKAQM